MLIMIAVFNGNRRIGIMNESAKISFDRNVDLAVCQDSLCVDLFSNSSETCMLNASESESAIAIIIIPPRTTDFKCVLECKPTIIPNVVMMPDVMPNPKPLFVCDFI